MFRTILQKANQYSRAALAAAMHASGTAALYLGTSTLLAGVLLATLLTFAWDIDSKRWYRALATLQGIELAEIQQAEREAAAAASFEDTIERRAERLRQDEFAREITGRTSQLQLPPEDPGPPMPPPPSDADRIGAYEQRIRDDRARAQSAGLDEQTRLIENMIPNQAKEVIRRLWRDGSERRVMDILLAMEDRPRERILFAMQETNDDELRDLCEILQRIGDGEPMRSAIDDAARE